MCSKFVCRHIPDSWWNTESAVFYYFCDASQGIDVALQKWANLTKVDQADRNNEVVQMCWNDSDHNEVIYLLY